MWNKTLPSRNCLPSLEPWLLSVKDIYKSAWTGEHKLGLTWVWAMTLITWQYFFMLLKSFSSCFLPSSSCHFLQYLVKAFFLDLCLQGGAESGIGTVLHQLTKEGGRVEEAAQRLVSAHCWLLRSLFHQQAEPGLIKQRHRCQSWAEPPQICPTH